MLGLYIKSRFNSLLSLRTTPIGEEELFIDLAQALDATIVYSKSKIIHKKRVYFKSPKVFNYSARQICELGDLRIVFFSPRLREVRETVMQCKYERNNKILAKSRFKCQMNQLHLLSKKLPYREKLKAVSTNNELLHSHFHTKTSYGIFYLQNGDYDLLCASAPHIFPHSPKAKSNIRQAKVNCNNYQVSFNSLGYEVLRSNNLLDFGNLIDNMLFGEKLYPKSSTAVISTVAKLKIGIVNSINSIDESIFDIPRIIYNNDIQEGWEQDFNESGDDLTTVFVNVDNLKDNSNKFTRRY